MKRYVTIFVLFFASSIQAAAPKKSAPEPQRKLLTWKQEEQLKVQQQKEERARRLAAQKEYAKSLSLNSFVMKNIYNRSLRVIRPKGELYREVVCLDTIFFILRISKNTRHERV